MQGEALAIVVKGFPRLSETFIARELEGFEQRGLRFSLHALRQPSHDAALTQYKVSARCQYLPEYLHDEPLAVLKAIASARKLPGFEAAVALFLRHIRRDFSRARVRRFGQACVLATRLGPDVRHVHAHFAHSPASVARYAAMMRRITYSLSAHAKDVWTDPEWDLREKLAGATFVAVCNRAAHARLAGLMPTEALYLIHHGISRDIVAGSAREQVRDGSRPDDPVLMVTVARAVEKKGLRTLLKALAHLPGELSFRLDHYGDGDQLGALMEQCRTLGLEQSVRFHGAVAHSDVIEALDRCDLFVLPVGVAESGDRDGIPNALLEAKARGVCVVACDAGGTGEAVANGVTGRLVPSGVPELLAQALADSMRNPKTRQQFATNALLQDAPLFDADIGYERLVQLLRRESSG